MNIQDIINDYKNSCINHGSYTENGKYKLANKSYDNIINSYNTLKNMGEIGIKALAKLLDDPNLSVQLWASTHLLPYNESLAKKKLTELTLKPGIVSLHAEITLDEWDNGHLQL